MTTPHLSPNQNRQTQTGIAVQNNTSKKASGSTVKNTGQNSDSTTLVVLQKTTTPVKPVAATEVKTTQATQPVSAAAKTA